MKFMSVERINTIGEVAIDITSWIELDVDTLSKTESAKLAKLLGGGDVVVANDTGAPCPNKSAQTIMKLLLK